MLKLGVTQATIHQRLRDEQGLVASVASVKRWVAANLPEEVRPDQVTVLGDEAEPGAEAQIDYGHLGSWTDPRSGRKHRVWAFVCRADPARMLGALTWAALRPFLPESDLDNIQPIGCMFVW